MSSSKPTNGIKRVRRSRSGLGMAVLAAGLASIPGAAALATVKPSKTRLQATATAVPVPTALEVPTTQTRSGISNPLQYYESQDYDELDFDVRSELDSVKKLQKSTGSEILNEELQEQVDSATKSPDMFLDAHVEDASLMEKVAMSSIPQQLPGPAIKALTKKSYSSSDKKKAKKFERVTHEQELELGRMIQRGVKLHKLRADFEKLGGREITRQEWTKLAELKSTKELRQQLSAYRQGKQLLVSANMGLVHAVVKQQYASIRKTTGLSFEELIQEGSLGLMRAAELFDPSRGLRFSTYATIWIKGHLSNSHVTDGSITLPQREKTKWNKIVKAHDELSKLRGGEPTVEEIAHHLKMKVGDVVSTRRKMTQAQQVMSLDYEYSTQSRSGTEGGTLNRLETDTGMMQDADLAEKTQLRADIIATMARNLDSREARLMRLRYGLGDGKTRSISQCAEAMGLSQTRVQQLAKQCLKKLREAAEAESLEEYLLTVA